MTQLKVRQAVSPADFNTVRELCWCYRDYLANFSEEVGQAITFAYPEAEYAALLNSLEIKHSRPKGLVLVAEIDGEPIGCGMYHSIGQYDAEIKRVFVQERARRTGVAAKISQALLENAKVDGYRRVLLDTSRQLKGAQKLYEKMGFQQRGSYSDLPTDFKDLLVFYEFKL